MALFLIIRRTIRIRIAKAFLFIYWQGFRMIQLGWVYITFSSGGIVVFNFG